MIVENMLNEFMCVFTVEEVNVIVHICNKRKIRLLDIVNAYEEMLYAADVSYERSTEILTLMIDIRNAISKIDEDKFSWCNNVVDYIMVNINRIIKGEFTKKVDEIRVDRKLYNKIMCACKFNKIDTDTFIIEYSKYLNIHNMVDIEGENKKFINLHNEALRNIMSLNGRIDDLEKRVEVMNNSLLLVV